jgi:hypothetical protein
MTVTAREALRTALNGDVASIITLERFTDAELSDAASGLTLMLSSAAVARVLGEYDKGRLADEVVQRWASFMRRGFLTRTHGPVRPLDIDFEAAHEDAIVEALARLDDLGDIIDGELREGEAEQLRKDLLGA